MKKIPYYWLHPFEYRHDKRIANRYLKNVNRAVGTPLDKSEDTLEKLRAIFEKNNNKKL